MGMYLNSISSYCLYKSETGSPYFVDKSLLLKELFPLADTGNNHICITRPRRFGKTVMANMIGAFFGKGTAASGIFDNLKISGEKDYRKHLNQYNVIYIDFSLLGLLQFENNREIESNAEAGDGYSDIVIRTQERTGVVIEVKYADGGNLEKACAEVLEQIETKKFDSPLRRDGMKEIIKYGIAFYKKQCKVAEG